MADTNVHRSQAILRMPVKYLDATLILHDGERSEVIFFVPPNEGITRLITEGPDFVPVMRNAKICIIARSAIAAIGVIAPAVSDEGELPSESQRVNIRLRSGLMLDGELRWTIVMGEQRTADHLNGPALYVELRAADRTYFVMKTHVATVQEA